MATVVEVAPHSKLLEDVQVLWRTQSGTLGFLPEGAFEEHAREGCILAAIDGNGSLIGYVLFRTTHRRQAAIAHLCVDNMARKQGIARLLFEGVKERVFACDDIIVRCRRDFEANQLWPHLNFIAVGEESGRGKKPAILTIWRYELNKLPLLAVIGFRGKRDAMSVAIDANIFFDLDENAPGREESKALQADWLGEFIELCLTDEIYNEINRNEDPAQRRRQRARVERFPVLVSDKRREEQLLAELRILFPNWTSESARSDMNQLAKVVAADSTYFATRDQLVREQADVLYDRYGLVVVSPYEIVLRFDELRREKEYRPQRFVALGLTQSKPRGDDDLEGIVDLIHVGQPSQEPRKRTLSRLRDVLADTARYELTCIKGRNGMLVAAYAIERPSASMLRLPLFAVADSDLGKTAARHFAEKISTLAAVERRTIVQVEAAAGGPRIEEALHDAGFFKEGNLWIKVAVPLVASAGEIAAEIVQIGSQCIEAIDLTTRVTKHLHDLEKALTASPDAWFRLERLLWPAKILSTGLRCFIVPIRPHWAEHLFDTELAKGTLFGAHPLLAMNSENAYYSAAISAKLTAPARVLWYVSGGDKAYHGTMAVRACSYIDEVIITGPKEAFRRFRRLGVYAWRDVFDTAGNKLENNVLAFRFSKTELFRRPVPLDRLREVLSHSHGKVHPLIAPFEISETCFIRLYKAGMHEG
jgi:hypothetical protein